MDRVVRWIRCRQLRRLVRIRVTWFNALAIACCVVVCTLHLGGVFYSTHLQLDIAAQVGQSKNLFVVRHTDATYQKPDGEGSNTTVKVTNTSCEGKLCFPETETLLKYQHRVFVPRGKHPIVSQHDNASGTPMQRADQVKGRRQPINFTIPSTMTNSTPFSSGTCYRQVHLWSDENRSFSGRTGDFSCPGLPCGLRLVVNTDVQSLKSSDAVILFHRTVWEWGDMQRRRPRGQKWIFYTQESPINTKKHIIPPKEYSNTSYDYIMTYTQDSHIYGAYGRYNSHVPEQRFTDLNIHWVENKTRLVAWVASNCNMVSWDRTGFVKALSRYVPVGMYGKCGKKSCPKDDRCHKKLRKYKFYLALENGACRDYITEKLWRNAYLNNAVPIVYGPPREDYERLLPPDSFIHVQDFNSIKELANYLRHLDKDETMYSTYFEWKKFGSVQLTLEEYLMEPEQVCSNIVSRLMADEREMREGMYEPPELPSDWEEWWTGSCVMDPPKYPIYVK